MKKSLLQNQEIIEWCYQGLGNIFSPNECNKTAKIMLQCCKKHGFEYIPFTKMLNKLGYDENIFYISN